MQPTTGNTESENEGEGPGGLAGAQDASGPPASDAGIPRLIVPKRYSDQRGWFCETWNARRLAQAGIATSFVQDNEAYSSQRGTIRGLHFQMPPHGQAKLIRPIHGRIYDVAVDVRRGSPTYGNFVAAELSTDNGHQLYVPVGFAHGYCTLDEGALIAYKVSDYYAPAAEGGIRFDDPDIGIRWPVDAGAEQLSDKDRLLPWLREWESPFPYHGEPLRPLAPA